MTRTNSQSSSPAVRLPLNLGVSELDRILSRKRSIDATNRRAERASWCSMAETGFGDSLGRPFFTSCTERSSTVLSHWTDSMNSPLFRAASAWRNREILLTQTRWLRTNMSVLPLLGWQAESLEP